MGSELMMDAGISGKTKAMILGGVVVVFALTIGILTHTGKAAAKPKPAAVQNAQAPLPAPVAAPATSDTQLADNEMIPQAAAPAPDGAASSSEPTTVAASPETDAAAQVAVSAPGSTTSVGSATGSQIATDAATSPASASPSSNVQDTGSWGQASLDDQHTDRAEQEVAARAPVSQPRSAVRPPPPPAIDALQPWWRAPAKAQGFNVQYVGQAANEKALVFRFSNNIADPHQAAQHIRVTDDKGEAANGVWVAGNNPYVLVYQGVMPGRYTVSIDPALSSVGGAKLGASLQGPVYVN
ncbi:hypothetical protein [Solimonas terrae]|uniref:Uncharacterized protein n=1 Tax=Solimonas terrae TaxID=1396819 RepID=A0A6M2BWA2_9GAMM|nr:hypothetical protein [Solimonas terrae]NGY06620.1 hypothetical protein [Solimonas terrae]